MYNRSEIMKAAWDGVRNMKFKDHAARLRAFARELRQAWFNAKMAVHRAQMSAVDRIREAILSLESKDRLTPRDWAELSRLRGELAKAREQERPQSITAKEGGIAA
ncbi:MAG: hypothetical protein ACWA40_09670 [Planktomarina sp.]